MADGDGANLDRPAMTGPSNQHAPQARPASMTDETVSTFTNSRVPSKSPQQHPLPPPESAGKPPLIESQPMTTSSSSSSLPPDHQMDKTNASPYGTRSRNRTGNPRPNYAEDRELDMEYEWTSARKSQGTSAPIAPNNVQSGDSDKASAGNTRRSSTTMPNGLVPGSKSMAPNTQNTNLPGMSTFSAYPEANNGPALPALTRKRKAPGSVPVASHSSSIVTSSAAAGISRRNGASPQASRLRMTNLMTFENCQGYLKNGKLKADDGTVLAVNGKFPCRSPLYNCLFVGPLSVSFF